jgi:hypothetical protein
LLLVQNPHWTEYEVQSIDEWIACQDLKVEHPAGKMNRLQKFVERQSDSGTVGRVAYAFGPTKLPEATPGFEWQEVSFNAGDELVENAGLKEIFRAAIVKGCAVVER